MKKKSKFNFRTVGDLCNYLGVDSRTLENIAKDQNKFWHKMSISKNGKTREVFSANPKYKKLLKKINHLILSRLILPPSFKGGIKGQSPATNAMQHAGKKYILCIDIKSFYPSVNKEHVVNFLYKVGFYKKPAELMCKILLVNDPHAYLPQGFPTSSLVAAHTLKDFDKKLFALGKHYGWSHTIYVDDIVLSSHRPLLRHLRKISALLGVSGFELSEKTKSPSGGERMVVTSVVVNKKPNITKEAKNLLLGSLRQIKKYGVRQYLERKNISPTQANIQLLHNKLRGRIANTTDINRPLGKKLHSLFSQIRWGQQD